MFKKKMNPEREIEESKTQAEKEKIELLEKTKKQEYYQKIKQHELNHMKL